MLFAAAEMKTPDQALQPTAGRRVILDFRMKQLSILAKRALATGRGSWVSLGAATRLA